MSFTMVIAPLTLIAVQLLKTSGVVPKRWLAWTAVIFGGVVGLTFGMYYRQDLFVHIVQGLIYGASASGLYDAGKSSLPSEV